MEGLLSVATYIAYFVRPISRCALLVPSNHSKDIVPLSSGVTTGGLVVDSSFCKRLSPVVRVSVRGARDPSPAQPSSNVRMSENSANASSFYFS